jgi:hypothetical protein
LGDRNEDNEDHTNKIKLVQVTKDLAYKHSELLTGSLDLNLTGSLNSDSTMGYSRKKNAKTFLNNLCIKQSNTQKLNDVDNSDDDAELIAWQNHKYLKRKSPKLKKNLIMYESNSVLTAASLFMPRNRINLSNMHCSFSQQNSE